MNISNDDNSSPGIRAIYDRCYALYPNQPTPPQVTAVQKFWLGGPDPLDYISMYENIGHISNDSNASSPPHWHYVSYGLSDLYGDSRLHDQKINCEGPSGFGFELTFRLKKYSEEKPPLWPAMVLQSLSRYLFRSQSKFEPGDHIPWDKPLEELSSNSSEEGFEKCDSNICNMMIILDPQLSKVNTDHGWVNFLQIVGVTDEEVNLARKRNGLEILEKMQKFKETGGWLLVTDTRRVETILNLDPNIQDELLEKNKSCGSTMSGVTTEVQWSCGQVENTSEYRETTDNDSIIDVVGDSDDSEDSLHTEQLESTTPFFGINVSPGTLELFPARYTNSVRVRLSLEAAKLMICCIIPDRLRVGRHFTFHNSRSDVAVTLIPERVTGAFVSANKIFGFRGSWLQVYINEECISEIENEFTEFENCIKSIKLPRQIRLDNNLVFIIEHM